ncbi:hypothetical protein [Prosthecobacter vanneervenii]|uniref:Uncharacterized protein n=1 Tax=Prosthecobacter vanneervenii TaxID=48466 RepID=A0A7W7YDP0_9BACT|nr:hypothetical protein [Prosthecobacter vanneervenii]MBB5034286.1 hypothetical protein [Prosthecobacter vanneervenii]
MNPSPSPSSRWKAVLLLLLVFILGAGCGIGGGLLVVRRALQHAIAHPSESHAPVDRLMHKVESVMVAELALTETERAAVHAELQQTATDFKALRLEMWQKAGANVEGSLDRICKHLPAEKQALLRKKAVERLGPWGLLSDDKS